MYSERLSFMCYTRIRRHRFNKPTTLIVFGMLAITGCGGDGMTTVVGKVTVNGTPLTKGAITFEPIDGVGRTAGATIDGGNYETRVPPGEKRVRITGFEVTGQVPAYKGMKDSPMRDIVKEIVPDKYNIRSDLKLSVESSDTTGDFDLKSS